MQWRGGVPDQAVCGHRRREAEAQAGAVTAGKGEAPQGPLRAPTEVLGAVDEPFEFWGVKGTDALVVQPHLEEDGLGKLFHGVGVGTLPEGRLDLDVLLEDCL